MLAGILTFAGSPIGRYVVGGLVLVLLVGGALLYVYGQGEAAGAAAVTSAALAEAARRAAAANKARNQVDQSPEAINNDPYNRDRQ